MGLLWDYPKISQAQYRVNYSMKIGITGGMGCGKSTATAMLVAAGYDCIDSDQLIRDEVLRDPEVIKALNERFG